MNTRQQSTDEQRERVRIMQELKRAGMSAWGLWRAESHYLHRIVHHGEHIEAVVYGYRNSGFVMLVATDRRLIYLDKKFLSVSEDELSYGVVYGVSYNQAGFGATVILHTHVDNYAIFTFNTACAQHFAGYIERRCLDSGDDRSP